VFLSAIHIVGVLKETAEAALARFRDDFLLWAPVFLGLGAGLYFGMGFEPPFARTGSLWAGALGLLLGLWRWSRNHPERESLAASFWIMAAVVVTLSGFALAQLRTVLVDAPMITKETRPLTISGTVESAEKLEGRAGTVLILSHLAIEDWAADETPRKVKISTKTFVDAAAGDQITLLAKLMPLSSPVMPYGYDFARHYYFEEIGATGIGLSPVKQLEGKDKEADLIDKIRKNIAQQVDQNVPPEQAGIVKALMTGERAAISDDDWQSLRVSGLAHIISISGLHVTLMAVPVFFLVRLLLAAIPFIALRYPIKKFAAVAALVACSLYVGLVVPSVPSTRALIMTAIGLIAIMLDRSPFSLRIVAVSAILVLVFTPESIWSVSFQMSFAAVTLLVAMAEATRGFWIAQMQEASVLKKFILFLVGSMLTSFVASLATAPFAMINFHQFASYSVLANTLSIPVTSLLIMPMLMISFALMPIGLGGYSLGAMGYGVEWLLAIARYVESLPYAQFIVPQMPQTFLLCIVAAMIAGVLFAGRFRALAFVPLILAVFVIMDFKAPDMIVSRKGTLAIHDQETMIVSNKRRDKFAAEEWRKSWGVAADAKKTPPKEGEIELTSGGTLRCDLSACRIEKGVMKIAYGHSLYALAQECSWADMMISTQVVPKDLCKGRSVKVFGKWQLEDAQGLSLDTQTGEMVTVRAARGNRPWVKTH